MATAGKTAVTVEVGPVHEKPHDFRCRNCGRLLFRAIFAPGVRIEIRCPRSNCSRTQIYTYENSSGKKKGSQNQEPVVISED